MNLSGFDSLNILYEDVNLIAIDKPAGIASISENDTTIETIHSLLEKNIPAKSLLFIELIRK
jgi:23S rRNA-/tRNA-specific pseudouridylate synthase